jgi:catechol 2,3-dioxygenase-like lactoylglutathione lyase family enzyme
MSTAADIKLPLNQIAFAVLDLRRTEAWWREGLGFLPAGGNRLLFRPPLSDGKVQKLPGAAMTCWCMVGRSEWAQLEFFQYERPISKLMPEDYRACDLGYSRMGVWVADFDAALAGLKAHDGTAPIGPVLGAEGQRRACVRNPDGVYVEIMEDDPLPKQSQRGRLDCPVAIRYATLSTPDLKQSAEFLRKGLGITASKLVLHGDEHEALWGLEGARCERKVFVDGSGQATMLLELVQYREPLGTPLPADYRLCDQRILNVCFGDPEGFAGVAAMHRRALAAGATQTTKPLNLGLAGCVYVDDPLGFSYEFMFAAGARMHKAFGFLPTGMDERPQLDNRRIESEVFVPAKPDKVFAVLADHEGLGEWTGLGACTLDKPGARERNGRGAERVISTPLGPIREQVTEWRPKQGYRYRVIAGGLGDKLMVGHWGEVSLTPEGKGTRVRWSIRFRSRLPGLGGVLQVALQSQLDAAMSRLPERCRT